MGERTCGLMGPIFVGRSQSQKIRKILVQMSSGPSKKCHPLWADHANKHFKNERDCNLVVTSVSIAPEVLGRLRWERILGFNCDVHSVVNDVPVDSETPVVTSFQSRWFASLVFEDAHRGRICIYMFIEMWVSELYCVISKKNYYCIKFMLALCHFGWT